MFELFTKWGTAPVTAVTGTVTGDQSGNINESSDVTTVTDVTDKKQSTVDDSTADVFHLDSAENSQRSVAGAVTPVTPVTNRVISNCSGELASINAVTTTGNNAVTPVTESLDIQHRLMAANIAIAIDNIDATAWPIFNEGDRQAVQNVASVYKPFEVSLNALQKQELMKALRYHEDILSRRKDGREGRP
jgi:hypothetical protein